MLRRLLETTFFLLLLLDDLDFYLNFFFGNSQKVMKSYLKRVQILWMRIIWFKKKKKEVDNRLKKIIKK